MTQFLTNNQLNLIKSIKTQIREYSEFSGLLIVRKYEQEIAPDEFNPYQLTGVVKYLDNVIKARLIHIDNKWQKIEVGGNVEDSVYKIVCNLSNYQLLSCADEIIIDNDYSTSYTTPPTIVDESSIPYNTLLGTTYYINYNTDGTINGDRIYIMGKRETIPNMDEVVLYAKLGAMKQ